MTTTFEQARQIGQRTSVTPIYSDGQKDCCESTKQPGEITQSLMRLNDAVITLESRLNTFMPRLASVQRQVPSSCKGEQAKKGSTGVNLADCINDAHDRLQYLIGIVHDNEEILDL